MAELLFLEFRAFLLFAGLLLSTYTDLKYRLILDKVTYPLIALGILLNLVTFHPLYFVIPALVLAFSYLLYYLGGVGGGDVKMFTAIALLLPFYQGQVFILNVLIAASASSLAFLSVYFFLKYLRTHPDLSENRESVFRALLLGIVLAACLLVLSYYRLMPALNLGLFSVLFLLFLPYVAFQKGIYRTQFVKTVPLEKLEEDEIAAQDFLDEKTKEVLQHSVRCILSPADIAKLKAAGIREIPLLRGLPPFAPFLLLGFLASLLFPEFFAALYFVPLL